MPVKVWGDITYPFPTFNVATVEVLERICYFIPYFTMDYYLSMLKWTLNQVRKRGPGLDLKKYWNIFALSNIHRHWNIASCSGSLASTWRLALLNMIHSSAVEDLAMSKARSDSRDQAQSENCSISNRWFYWSSYPYVIESSNRNLIFCQITLFQNYLQVPASLRLGFAMFDRTELVLWTPLTPVGPGARLLCSMLGWSSLW